MKIGDLPDITAFSSDGFIPIEINGSTKRIPVSTFLNFGLSALTANYNGNIFSVTDSNENFKITSSSVRIFGSHFVQLKFVAQTQSAISVSSNGLASGVTGGNPIGTIKSGVSCRPMLETVAFTLDRQGPMAFCSIGTDGVVRLHSFASYQTTIAAYTNLTFVATYITP